MIYEESGWGEKVWCSDPGPAGCSLTCQSQKAELPACVPIWGPSGTQATGTHTHKHEETHMHTHCRVEAPHCLWRKGPWWSCKSCVLGYNIESVMEDFAYLNSGSWKKKSVGFCCSFGAHCGQFLWLNKWSVCARIHAVVSAQTFVLFKIRGGQYGQVFDGQMLSRHCKE